ncbi:BamA/TamA family outer membrane protein [Hydrogenophaga sp. PAMC20947]|uniref:autotransporter assembly complex protein TamA n=1 Tax=Hydrogenophaga sp. PAMC20947 TaxID=2565558 RepID=UPI00109DA2B1|nr:BamA/TamA family outer membrane protein [Hydrogenophaga sp. PAMC20947]QCB48280.1 outer membrane protein assembly factor [Hydrogenophaga sp. PAMC20947]
MNPPFLRRVASPTRLFCILVCLLPLGAWAQDGSARAADLAPATPEATETPANQPDADQVQTDASAPPRFGITVETDGKLKPFVLRHIDLQRFRTLGDLDSSELNRLLLAAPDNLRDLLGTQGYFSPTITVSRVAATAGGKTPAPPLGDVRIVIEPGPATRVATSNVYFSGDILSAEIAKPQRESIVRSSQKAVGTDFTQSRWDQVKSETLRQLTAERYPRGRIANSLSDIDATKSEAHWYVELDSGPAVQIGEVRVVGGERYDTLTAERLVRLAGLHPGADYSLSKLQDAQQKISDSGYYTSVFAYVDLDQDGTNKDSAAPVVVQVKEGLPQKVTLGVGGSTNNGARLSLEHTHLQLPLIGWRAHSKLQLETNDQLLSSDWNAPIQEDGWHWLASGKLARQIDDDTTTSGLRVSAGKSQERADLDRRYFLQYDRARTVNTESELASSDGYESALSLNYGWTWRRFDNVPFPDRGYGLGVTLGVGTTLGTERKPFFSTQARWLGYWPLGGVVREDLLAGLTRGEDRPADTRSRNGRLALRLQGGAVTAETSAEIPDTLLYLTGGDTTVRGYGLRDIGVEESDGTVSAGRYLAVASFEWQRPIWSDGIRTEWESVVFVDAGAVADDPADLQAKVGVGAGVRYNSPVGPLQLDLAYGLDPKKFRIHLNVGFSF